MNYEHILMEEEDGVGIVTRHLAQPLRAFLFVSVGWSGASVTMIQGNKKPPGQRHRRRRRVPAGGSPSGKEEGGRSRGEGHVSPILSKPAPLGVKGRCATPR